MAGPFTRAQLRAKILTELQDPSGIYFTVALVNDLLDEAVAEFCEKTRLRRATVSIDVMAETATVNLDAITPPVLEVLGVYAPSGQDQTDEIPLELMSQEDLDAQYLNWRLDVGRPWAYYRFNKGFEALGLYPIPQTDLSAFSRSDGSFSWTSLYGDPDAVDGTTDTEFTALYGGLDAATDRYGGLRIDYVAGGSPMTADGDYPPGVAAVHHDVLRDYVVGRCHMMETAIKQYEKGKDMLSKFYSRLDEIRGKVQQDFQDKPDSTVQMMEF